jgi:hypothetical protein
MVLLFYLIIYINNNNSFIVLSFRLFFHSTSENAAAMEQWVAAKKLYASVAVHQILSRFLGKDTCPVCHVSYVCRLIITVIMR